MEYFFLKLSDPGTTYEYNNKERRYKLTEKLTFKSGTDAPDDCM
jgi:hypothetical protein